MFVLGIKQALRTNAAHETSYIKEQRQIHKVTGTALLKCANTHYSHVTVVVAGEVLSACEGRDVTAFTERSVHNYTCCIVQSIWLID
jgi:hypothetical protein